MRCTYTQSTCVGIAFSGSRFITAGRLIGMHFDQSLTTRHFTNLFDHYTVGLVWYYAYGQTQSSLLYLVHSIYHANLSPGTKHIYRTNAQVINCLTIICLTCLKLIMSKHSCFWTIISWQSISIPDCVWLHDPIVYSDLINFTTRSITTFTCRTTTLCTLWTRKAAGPDQ